MLDEDTYWLLDDLVLAGPWPRSLERLQLAGVTILVNLTEHDYEDDRFVVHAIPIPDYTGPGIEQIVELCRLVDRAEASGDRLYVHCQAGCGRTGTMMACLLVARRRLDAAAAIAEVRGLRPCSIESDAQEDAVAAWETYLRMGA